MTRQTETEKRAPLAGALSRCICSEETSSLRVSFASREPEPPLRPGKTEHAQMEEWALLSAWA